MYAWLRLARETWGWEIWGSKRWLPRQTGGHPIRAFDILLAAATLLIALPLFVGIGFVIWLEDREPVFKSVKRRRRGGELVEVFAFRCTRVTPEPTADRPKDEAESLTAIGTFLRCYSMDGLPQLWSVVRGELSLREVFEK